MHLGGWLLLNGARFRNAEFPILASALKENYARQGRVFNDAEFTQLRSVEKEYIESDRSRAPR